MSRGYKFLLWAQLVFWGCQLLLNLQFVGMSKSLTDAVVSTNQSIEGLLRLADTNTDSIVKHNGAIESGNEIMENLMQRVAKLERNQ